MALSRVDTETMCTRRLGSKLLIDGHCFLVWLDHVIALQVVKMSLEHAGAPLTLEPKDDYMKRKIEERSLAPNSILNGAGQVCAMFFLLYALLDMFAHWGMDTSSKLPVSQFLT